MCRIISRITTDGKYLTNFITLSNHPFFVRDNFVHFYAGNVDPENEDQLDKYNMESVISYGMNYDLGSIMHYEITVSGIGETIPKKSGIWRH